MFERPFYRTRVAPFSSGFAHQWILWILLVLTGLFTGVLQSAPSDDFSGVHFVGQMHTIGQIDGTLWAIIKSDTKDFVVYQLTPCKAVNQTALMIHCMVISSPVPMDTKWPLLGESIKQSANITDYHSLGIENSVILHKNALNDTLVIMQSGAFHRYFTEYVGFCFGTNHLVDWVVDGTSNDYEGAWISSDEEDPVYQILGFGTKIQKLHLNIHTNDYISIYYNTERNMCNVGTDDQPMVLFTVDVCNHTMAWTINKGVHFRGAFYLFDTDRVFIFSDKAQNESSKVYVIRYEVFLSYVAPTTTVAPQVNSIVFVYETNESTTTAKGFLPSTILLWIVLAGFALLGIGLIIYCYVLPGCNDHQEGDINKRNHTPNTNNTNNININPNRVHTSKNASHGLKGPSKNRLSPAKCKNTNSNSKPLSKVKVVAKVSAKASAKTSAKLGAKICSKSRENKMSISKVSTGKHFSSSKLVYNKLNKS